MMAAMARLFAWLRRCARRDQFTAKYVIEGTAWIRQAERQAAEINAAEVEFFNELRASAHSPDAPWLKERGR